MQFNLLYSQIRTDKSLRVKEQKKQQVNRGVMRKIPVTRQFLEAGGSRGQFFEKTTRF